MEEQRVNEICDTFYSAVRFLSADTSGAKHLKSLLRHAVAEMPGENPELWGWLINQIPEELQGAGSKVSYEEYALYITLSMYAIGPLENKNLKLAEAVADAELKRQKLVAVETADSTDELQVKLRSLVKLINSAKTGFNYGELVKDIFLWQTNKIAIARKWEREYAQKENRNE